MNNNTKNIYGYKLCKHRRIKAVTNTYNLALFINKLHKSCLLILPVKNVKEYNKLWKGCPFKDDLS